MSIATGDTICRSSLIRKLAVKALFALLLFTFHAMALRAQTIQIKLVDGKTGRPVKGVCVGAWMKDPRNKMTLFIPLDKYGVARLSLTSKDSEVGVSYNPKLGCGGTGAINPVLKYDDTLTTYSPSYYPSCAFPESMPLARYKEIDFSTNDVIQHGVVSANTCGKVVASPTPGEVILFVRPRSFHEKLHDWQASEAFPL